MAPPTLSAARAATSAAATAKTAAQQQPVQAPSATPKPRNHPVPAALAAGLLLASSSASPALAAPALSTAIAAPPAPTATQVISATTALKFPSVAAPQVRASDSGLMPRAASGPAINYDDPDAYFDALEGSQAAPAPGGGAFQSVKYIEAGLVKSQAVVGEVADLNADVNEASDYRDPAIATPQDKLAGSIGNPLSGASVPDLPDLSSAAESAAEGAKSAASDAKAKAKSVLSGSSALPASAFNSAVGEVADLNADVRNEASDYRDPAIATPQDKLAGSIGNPLSGASVPDLPDLSSAAESAAEGAKSAASDAKAKAKSVLSGSSALPASAFNSAVGEVADLNADVRNEASDYRDPAIATPQDKLAGSIGNPLSGASVPDLPDLSSAAESAAEGAKSAASDAKAKAKSVLSGSSALLNSSVGEVAEVSASDIDVSADVRPLQEQGTDTFADNVQNKLSGGFSSTRTPNLGKAAKSAASDAKAKAKSVLSGSSALPASAFNSAVGEVADLNADVRNEASDYRDPAAAVQQDTAADAASKASKASKDLPAKAKALPAKADARLSRPLVRDSLGQLRPQAVNSTGAAGGNQRGAKLAVKKAVNEAVEQVSGN